MTAIKILLFGSSREKGPIVRDALAAVMRREQKLVDIDAEPTPTLADVETALLYCDRVDVLHIANDTKLGIREFVECCKALATEMAARAYTPPPIVVIKDPGLCFAAAPFRHARLRTKEGSVQGMLSDVVLDRLEELQSTMPALPAPH